MPQPLEVYPNLMRPTSKRESLDNTVIPPRVVGDLAEDCACGFAACTDAVEAKFGGDSEDGLFAENIAADRRKVSVGVEGVKVRIWGGFWEGYSGKSPFTRAI